MERTLHLLYAIDARRTSFFSVTIDDHNRPDIANNDRIVNAIWIHLGGKYRFGYINPGQLFSEKAFYDRDGDMRQLDQQELNREAQAAVDDWIAFNPLVEAMHAPRS